MKKDKNTERSSSHTSYSILHNSNSRGFTPSLENGLAPSGVPVKKNRPPTNKLPNFFLNSPRREATKPFFSAGFTMVEVLVTLAIFTVISGVVLTRYKDFSGGIVLSNLAYEIAITIRQAQVYGLSVKNTLTPASNFNLPYGIHLPGPVSNSFVLFADANNNGYDSSSEIIETLTTRQGNTIQSFCAITILNATKCSTDSSGPLTSLDITFLRPEPDARFKSNIAGDVYKEAKITVSSLGNRSKVISVKSTGQISVQ